MAAGTSPAKAELMWRLSLPIACLVLIMLAIPLGFVNPRAGSSANMIIAVLIFFTYNNLIKVIESGIRRGKFTFAFSWWPLHVAMVLTVLALFAWRLNVNHRYHPRALWAAFKRGGGK
jgi:lipopolysaccharide export system permease protein